MLIEQVLMKLEKGKTIEVIADELESKKKTIQQICNAAKECGPDSERIYQWMKEKKEISRS